MPKSVETQVVAAVIVTAFLVAGAAAGIVWIARGRAVSSERVADTITDSVARGTNPQSLLDVFAAAGTIRSATLYDRAGNTIARSGAATPSAALVCRSLADGGSLCIEPAAENKVAVIPAFAIAAIAIGAIVAAIATATIRARLRSVREAIDDATRDPACSARINAPAGELAPLAASINRLFDQMQNRDVTLRRRGAELEAANKELEAFAYAVSHDLRAPLGSIMGFAQALAEDQGEQLDDGGRESIFWIRESANQMSHLIEGLLQMARFSSAEMRRGEVDLAEIARAIATSLQRGEPSRNVVFAIPDTLRANGDERLLRALLENLMANAWKFTSKRDEATIEVGVRDDNGYPAFFVRDNGAGFDPAHAAKMFRPFQRLHSDKEFSGTGIGLATVQKIVQRHGGRAWAEGEPQRGATIYFTTGSPHEAYA